MKVRDIAFSRSGDKGDINNICVFVYQEADWPLLRERLTVEAVRGKFSGLVHGRIDRYEFPNAHGLNFVLHQALGGGGASISIAPDPQGKSYQSLLQDIDL
jgi:hypothetical protein